MKVNQPYVAIIIVNWNNSKDTIECLSTLETLDYSNFSVYVIDCGSTDDSVDVISKAFPGKKIIQSNLNLGFSGGYNLGIRQALKEKHDYFFILNNDTLVDHDCLYSMVALGEKDEEVGIIGPMIYHHYDPVRIQSAGCILNANWDSSHIGQNEVDEGQHSSPVDWVSGCAMLVRRELVDDIGLIDERFFAYEEELDWCIRARERGWKIWFTPLAKVWHKGANPNKPLAPYVTYYMVRNKFLLLSKHKAPLSAWLFTWFETWRTLLSWTIKSKWRSKRSHRNAVWQGMLDFLRGSWGERANLG